MAETNNTKQAAWVGLGSLCSFGFALVSSAILSRYFNKADYGTYKQVMYVYTTLLTVFTLGLPKAFSYFLPRVELCQAKSLIRKITNLFFILGGVFSLLLFIFAPQIAVFLKNPDLTKALRYFAIVPFFLLPTMGLEGILATFKQTKFIAVYNIATNIFKLLCVAIPVMIWGLGYIEAIIGFVIASFITFLLALYLKFKPVKGQPNDKCSITYKDIFKFSIPLLTASLWGILITSADQFFISRYFGNEVFADFANGALELPFVGMIVGACSTVLSPLYAKISSGGENIKEQIIPLWKSSFEKSAMLIYPLLIYFIVFADFVMVFLYGEMYRASATYFRIKTLVDFLRVITFAPLIINIGKVKFYSRVHMFSALILIALEYVSVITIHSPYVISIISMLSSLGRILVMLSFIAKYLEIKFKSLFPISLILKLVIPMTLFLLAEHYLFTKYIIVSPLIVLVLSSIIYALVFMGYSKLVRLDYMKVIKPLIKK